jgi:hypothetical protein
MSSTYSDYNHGFTHGVTVRNVPINLTLGTKAKTFWVDSVHGNDHNLGTFTRPFATLDYAIGECAANRGDTIYVSAKHAETVVAASGITFDVAGVSVIFLGEGSDRGTITFSTLVAASIVVSAANVTIKDARFVAGIDALTSPIAITGANCRISGEWYDAPAKAATDCIITSAAADGLIIDGWKYYESTTGTQKNSQIRLLGVDNAVVKNIDIVGDFIVANINNLTTECLNLRLEDIKLKNINATPKPGIVLQANTTGFAKNLDVRIASGTTYISSLAKINWDNNCLGYNSDGTGGDPIGGATGGSIEAKIDAIQADIGDPSARANFPSLETMIGIPDAVNSNLGDIFITGYDSTATVPGANGSVLERLEVIQAALASPQGDLYKVGTCDVGMVDSKTSIVAADLAGMGDDFYNLKYYMQVIRNDNSHGAAPETEIRQITDYTSVSGTFVVNAFSANVQASDRIALVHESLVSGTSPIGTMVNTVNTTANTINTNIGDPSGHTLTTLTAKLGNSATTVTADFTTVKAAVAKIDGATLAVAPTAGSLATFIASGGVGLGTALDNSKSLVDALGSNGTTVVATAGSVGGQVLLTKAEALKIDSATLAVSPTAGSLARFVASGGTALGTPLADSKSLINAIGTDGTTAAAATAASAVSLFGAIGTNEADATTPFSSANVQANADGTVLEREEFIQAQTNKLDTVTLAVAPGAGSLATFIASGGVALGTPLATSKSLINCLGTDGTTANVATAASAVSLFGAIGTNEADATTPFSSANVQANADGTVLEREEYIQAEADKIDMVTLAVSPAAGSLAQFIASGGTALGAALAASKSIVDAIGSNGSALVYGAGSALGAIGTVFTIKKTMVSSAVLESAPVAITSASSGGELQIENVVVKTDGTGLATGTNFEVKTNNARGELNFFVETVANLGASKTVDMAGASVTGENTVLESGKILQVHATGADCTGAGEIDIYVTFRRLSAGATVAAL